MPPTYIMVLKTSTIRVARKPMVREEKNRQQQILGIIFS